MHGFALERQGPRALTEAIHGNTGVVDQNVNALGMLPLDEVADVVNALGLRDVQRVVLDLCGAAILGQRLRALQLIVLEQALECGFPTAFIAGRKVNEERTVVGGRLGVLQS